MTTREQIDWYLDQITDEKILKRILAEVARAFLTDTKKPAKE